MSNEEERWPSCCLRKWPRVSFIDTAMIELPDGSQLKGDLKNLSFSGALVVTKKKLPLGEMGRIIIELRGCSGGERVACDFRVIHLQEEQKEASLMGLGVEFINIDQENAMHLHRMVQCQKECNIHYDLEELNEDKVEERG